MHSSNVHEDPCSYITQSLPAQVPIIFAWRIPPEYCNPCLPANITLQCLQFVPGYAAGVSLPVASTELNRTEMN